MIRGEIVSFQPHPVSTRGVCFEDKNWHGEELQRLGRSRSRLSWLRGHVHTYVVRVDRPVRSPIQSRLRRQSSPCHCKVYRSSRFSTFNTLYSNQELRGFGSLRLLFGDLHELVGAMSGVFVLGSLFLLGDQCQKSCISISRHLASSLLFNLYFFVYNEWTNF